MDLIPNKFNQSWNDFMNRSDIREEIKKIELFLENKKFFPAPDKVLRFLETDLNKIKVIIVGLEPYPSSYEKDGAIYPVATGRSFEVANINSWSEKFKQSSLRNIIKAIYYNSTGEIASLEKIRDDIKDGRYNLADPKQWFDNLENQGVLFLNSSLSVKQYEVKSHNQLWEYFVTELIKYIDTKVNPAWMLWGKDAQERVIKHVSTNKILCACHPRLSPFVNANPFNKVDYIDWNGISPIFE